MLVSLIWWFGPIFGLTAPKSHKEGYFELLSRLSMSSTYSWACRGFKLVFRHKKIGWNIPILALFHLDPCVLPVQPCSWMHVKGNGKISIVCVNVECPVPLKIIPNHLWRSLPGRLADCHADHPVNPRNYEGNFVEQFCFPFRILREPHTCCPCNQLHGCMGKVMGRFTLQFSFGFVHHLNWN